MKKRLLSLLLTLALLACLGAGCAKNAAQDTTQTDAAQTDAAQTPVQTETPEEPVQTQTDGEAAPAETVGEAAPAESPAAEPVSITYPVTDDVVTFSLTYSVFGFLSNYYLDSPFYAAFQEATGVAFELQEMSNDSYSEKMQLTIASGDYPDLATGMLSLFTNTSEAISEEVVLDIMPYLTSDMPDYYAAATAYEGGLASLTTEEGYMGAIYELYSTPNNYTSGYYIRDDYMQAAGYDAVPDTLDGFVDLLRAMKQNGVAYPLYANDDTDVTNTITSIWYGSWGYGGYFWDAGTQSVQWCHAQDYTLEYWTWLQGLWNEGLYLSSGTSELVGLDTPFNTMFNVGDVAAFVGKASTIDEELGALQTVTTVSAVPYYKDPSLTENGELVAITGDSAVSVTTNCEQVDLLLQAVNYLYTDAGELLNNFGTENEGFTYSTQGQPEYTDTVLLCQDAPQRFAIQFYTNPVLPGLTDPYAMSYRWSESALSGTEIWEACFTGNSATFSAKVITLTDAESEIMNLYQSDFETYLEETVYGMVYGSAGLTQANYDSFLAACYDSFHLQDILDVYTAAWLRYLARL